MIRVIIVAPYPTIRAGLRSVLTGIADIVAVADTDDLDALPALIEELAPDVLLVDLVDEPEAGMSALERLATIEMLPPVVLLSGSPADSIAGLSLPRASLLLRDATAGEIQAAIRSAVTGLVTIDPRIVGEIHEQLGSQRQGEPVEEITPLTPRELQVLQGISRGWPNKTIAIELGISEHTVKFHVGSIFEKLGVASRSEAVAVAARQGLLAL
jgi:DNA-binding NarL/FixJ family response regulator